MKGGTEKASEERDWVGLRGGASGEGRAAGSGEGWGWRTSAGSQKPVQAGASEP